MTEPFEHLIRSTLTDLAEEAPIVHDQLSRAERLVRNRRRATVTVGAVSTLAAILIATPIALAATGSDEPPPAVPSPAGPAAVPSPPVPTPSAPTTVPTVEPSPGGAPGDPSITRAHPAYRANRLSSRARRLRRARPVCRAGRPSRQPRRLRRPRAVCRAGRLSCRARRVEPVALSEPPRPDRSTQEIPVTFARRSPYRRAPRVAAAGAHRSTEFVEAGMPAHSWAMTDPGRPRYELRGHR